MPILDRESYFKSVSAIIGTNTSEEAMKFIEDMTDTYNDMERRITESEGDWKRKYEENDKAWKEKYKNRFFTGNGKSNIVVEATHETDDEKSRAEAETITYDNLFK